MQIRRILGRTSAVAFSISVVALACMSPTEPNLTGRAYRLAASCPGVSGSIVFERSLREHGRKGRFSTLHRKVVAGQDSQTQTITETGAGEYRLQGRTILISFETSDASRFVPTSVERPFVLTFNEAFTAFAGDVPGCFLGDFDELRDYLTTIEYKLEENSAEGDVTPEG